MDDKVTGEPYNEFKDSPLYSFGKKLFGKKDKTPAPRIPDSEFSKFQAVDDKIMSVFRFIANISALALCAIMIIAFLDVVGAKLHKAGISWISGISNSQAMIQYCHIPLVFLTAGFVTLDQGHTRIDLLCSKFPGWLEKGFLFLGHILGALISFYIAFLAAANILTADIAKQKTITNIPGQGWPKWPFTMCHIIGFTLLGLSFIWAMIRMIRFWKYKGVNPYYIMHPEKAMGPGEGPAEDEAVDIAENAAEGGNEQ